MSIAFYYQVFRATPSIYVQTVGLASYLQFEDSIKTLTVPLWKITSLNVKSINVVLLLETRSSTLNKDWY